MSSESSKLSINRFFSVTMAAIAVGGLVLFAFNGCNGDNGGSAGGGSSANNKFVTLGSAPVGGVFNQVGSAIASVTNDDKFKGDNDWKVQAKGTKGSKQNIRMLDKGEIQLGMSNSAISYHAARGLGGWDKEYKIRAVVTLAPNIGLFITNKSSGIKTISDLKSKRVSVGPAGAGFEMFLGPLMTEHGVKYSAEEAEFTPQNEIYTNAVQSLADGNTDAAFMGGAIPTPAVVQACNTSDIQFIQYDPAVRQKLIKDYPFFSPATIPAKNKSGNPTYKGMEADFEAMNVGSMQLITHADVDEDLIYNLTKTIWENRAEIVKQHPAARAINEKNAARNTGTEFHPGAIRFYKEIGIWPQDADNAESAKADSAGE